MLQLYQAVTPLRPSVDDLARGLQRLIPDEMRPYFRDVDDHLLRVTASIREFRELLTQILSANITQASFRQNEDVRKDLRLGRDHRRPDADQRHLRDELRAHAGASWRVGYPLALLLMAGLCLALYGRFRRSGWL